MSLTYNAGYRRTVLVIWPSWSSLGNGGGNRRLDHALSLLNLLHSSQPSADEEKLFHNVADWSQSSPQTSTLKTLCSLARRWLRSDLWEYACLSVGKRIPTEEAVVAVQTFGFEPIKEA
jgi:hypothetical protein